MRKPSGRSLLHPILLVRSKKKPKLIRKIPRKRKSYLPVGHDALNAFLQLFERVLVDHGVIMKGMKKRGIIVNISEWSKTGLNSRRKREREISYS